MKFFMGNALWHLVAQSDAMTKTVLGLLLCASVICWTFILYKAVFLHIKKKQLLAIRRKLQNIRTLSDLLVLSQKEKHSYPGYFLKKHLGTLKHLCARTAVLTDKEQTALEEQRVSLIEDMVYHESSYLSFLSVTAAVAPLLGLFGTVWGLTHSFMSISQKQSADIVTIAPGIAEALLTTLAGLLVAIPVSLLCYALKEQVAFVEHSLMQIADQVTFIIQTSTTLEKDIHEASYSAKTEETTAVIS